MPTPFLLSGNLQTIYYALTRNDFEDTFPFERILVKLKDGGQTSIDWICSPETDNVFTAKSPILVLLPGLTGDRCCEYLRVLIGEACTRKIKCAVINHRGCGHTPLITRKLKS